MSSMEKYSEGGNRPEVEFDMLTPATYSICVVGHLNPCCSKSLSGLTITGTDLEGKYPVTILQGEFETQAKLIGVLNVLFDMRLSLLSVELRRCK